MDPVGVNLKSKNQEIIPSVWKKVKEFSYSDINIAAIVD